MSRAGFTLALFLLASIGSLAQVPRPPASAPEDPQIVFLEAFSLPGTDSLSRIDVLYRLDESFFISSRNFDPAGPATFKRRGETVTEVLNAEGVSTAREIHRIEIESAPEKKEEISPRWYKRVATFAVPPGTYTVSLEVNDLESERRISVRSRPVEARYFTGDKIIASSPIFVTSVISDSVTPSNFGGDILISEKGGLFVQCFIPPALERDGARVHYSLRQTSRDREAGIPLADSTISISLMPENQLTPSGQGAYSLSQRENVSIFSLFVPLPFEHLRLRQFELQAVIFVGTDSVQLSRNFKTVWPGMPRSLRNVDIALDALRFITRKEELDSLKNGSFETRIQHLEGFWKPKDRTPETAINETMVEYYRRVDHAMVTFGTLRNPDGTHNDRGRIYVIHGQPTEVERNLDVEEAHEVWTYEHLRKRFIFGDKSRTGSYTLISTQSF